MFILQFDSALISELASRYSYPSEALVEAMGRDARARGFYTQHEFVDLCRWKSPRTGPLVARNSPEDGEEITRLSLATRSEAVRIQLPMILQGVSWGTASVLLHFAHQDPYPILDYRALESFGVEPPSSYTFEFWSEYVRTLSLTTPTISAKMECKKKSPGTYRNNGSSSGQSQQSRQILLR